MNLSNYIPQPGDTCIVWGTSWIDDAISWFTKGGHKRKHAPCHTFICYDATTMVHSTWPRVRRELVLNYLAEREKASDPWMMFRRAIAPPDYQIKQLQQYLDSEIGRIYAFAEFPFQALDGIIERVVKREFVFFRRMADAIPQNVVCSGLTGYAHIMAGWCKNDRPRLDTPVDTLDRLAQDQAWIMTAYGVANDPGAVRLFGPRWTCSPHAGI